MSEKRNPSYKSGRGSGRSTAAQRRRDRLASERKSRQTTDYNERTRRATVRDNQRVVKGIKSSVSKSVPAGIPKRRPPQRAYWPYERKNKPAIDFGSR